MNCHPSIEDVKIGSVCALLNTGKSGFYNDFALLFAGNYRC